MVQQNYISRRKNINMGIQVAIKHHTSYQYEKAIKMWPQVIRLRPAVHSRTKILAYALKISPANHFINWMQDPFGNFQARVVFPELVEKFEIEVEVIADLVSINPFDFFLDETAEVFPFEYDNDLKKELSPYLEVAESGSKLMQCVEDCKTFESYKTVDFLVAVNQYVYEKVNYSIRLEVGVQTCEETITKKLGSCRDSAWLLVQILRHFGLAARFVSGYLVQLKADVKVIDGPSGPEEDFTDLHAWAEVFVPGAGWIGLDATSGLFAGEGHIPLACTPHFKSAAPLTGATAPTSVQFDFSNSVERILETPRVTAPYTDQQAHKIRKLGELVDAELATSDVRLTMGGEPTFVSTSDMESEQWNIDADGKDKRKLAMDLALKLKNKFGANGFIHFGQGKWYPGEPIPRWQYAIYWRKDGQALWDDPNLIGNPTLKGANQSKDASSFMNLLSENLGLHKKNVVPAHEDQFYYLWEEHNLPENFDKEKVEEANIARQKLVEILEKGMEEATGFVLPLRKSASDNRWESCVWTFRRNKLFLIPGNSELGLRLPLDRLIQHKEDVEDIVVPASPIEKGDHLPNRVELEKLRVHRAKNESEFQKVATFTTAVCAQIVNGNLHLFLPPIKVAADFLDLLFCIEKTATKLKTPVIIEGYQPPFHNQITKLGVTPDPGVIEVNVHPAASWNEITTIYDDLFEAVDESGLGTNKFMVDGTHTGTGGGNHITLGGNSPAESPLLRRPDLLRSMVNFWQNHPSLSYLFSSQFVGPTSQAPRIDEGRPDVIYELEIAFAELERHGKNPPFWLVDRLFRNLLTDLTGNTHRSEFCIDKLYSPDSSTGRLGILELRGFDMPPHKEMCLVQLLLIRSLVAVFWKKPYKNKLVHWGTDLHNKFMMQHYIKEDIHEVVDYLNDNGVDFEKEWLDIFLEFRFPLHGTVNVKGINLSLRGAIEPWIVLGEEMTSAGTSRYVDSSVERLELVVEDINPDRYFILCNNVKVPLVKTAYAGKYVASIRYKAWAPYSALHPTIGVDSPLVFDIYDSWNERTIGGCTYHVVHPGGRSYDTFPVNSLEAESRRATRFWEFNHNPKQNTKILDQAVVDGMQKSYVTISSEIRENIDFINVPPSKEFPHTLDLRRV